MVRVYDFTSPELQKPVKLAAMSHGLAKDFVRLTKEMGDRSKQDGVAAAEWIRLQERVITQALTRANDSYNSERALAYIDEFDNATIDAMYLFILEKSGLRTAGQGEAVAASSSQTSKAV